MRKRLALFLALFVVLIALGASRLRADGCGVERPDPPSSCSNPNASAECGCDTDGARSLGSLTIKLPDNPVRKAALQVLAEFHNYAEVVE